LGLEADPALASSAIPSFVRAQGRVDLRFGHGPAGSQVLDWSETGGFRARFPTTFDDRSEAVLINTGGGMTGGDTLTQNITVGTNANVLVTTQAAEKIYRSDGEPTRIDTRLTLETGASLAFVPQETILFSGAHLVRTLHADMPSDATLTACESVFFGRAAMGEILAGGAFRDQWRLKISGRLVFAEDIRLEGLLNIELARKAVANGARAMTTLVQAGPLAPSQLESIRERLHPLHERSVEAGAGLINGVLVVRLLAMEAQSLRRELVTLLEHLLGRALPRTWST
jgi:urease accessory protein